MNRRRLSSRSPSSSPFSLSGQEKRHGEAATGARPAITKAGKAAEPAADREEGALLGRDLLRARVPRDRAGGHLGPDRRHRGRPESARRPSTSRSPRAASGRRRTRGRPGRRSSTTQGSYSIGCVTLDPKNPLVVWVGTGENNSQRSVGYGDGVYRSVDGGKTWENVGLKNVRAHREDPRRPARLERRLRRRAGTALGRRRRSRALQDDRRRQDAGRRS